MKKLYLFIALNLTLSCFSQVGVGTTTPNGALDVSSSINGFVPPRVALTATNAQAPVLNPQGGVIPAGTIVWNTATSGASPNNVAPGLYYWNGTRWVAFAGSPGGLDWSLTGNSGTTAGTNFLGTTDTQDIRFHTNNTERARILSGGTLGVNSVGTTYSQITVVGAGTNDGVAASANDNVANGFWGRNAHASGTAIIGATNGLGGIYPTKGAGIAGSGVNGYGIYASTGNGAPNNTSHAGNAAGAFTLDSDNNSTTNNDSAYAIIAGKDDVDDGSGSYRSLFGGYFRGGVSNGSYAYVAIKHRHSNAGGNGGTTTDYKILGNGSVSSLIPDENKKPRIMYAPEAPEILFQDFGVGKLVNGTCTINIDPILAKNIHVDEKYPLKVFIQLEGDCNGVYVTNKSANGFTVKELQNGNSNVSFSWQIVANRIDRVGENGEIASKHVGVRLPYGPKEMASPQLSSKKTEKENAK